MKKKWFMKLVSILLIICLLILQESTGTFHRADAAQTGTVMASSLNVRTKPSTTSDQVKSNGAYVSLTKGVGVNILQKNGDWYYISALFQGKTVKGYVLGSYISVSATTTPALKPPVPQSFTVQKTIAFQNKFAYKATVTSTTLNVRSGPATNYLNLATLKKGAIVTIANETIRNSVKWYGISFRYHRKTKRGYVSSQFVKLSFAGLVKGRITARRVYIRAAAKSKAAVKKSSSGKYIALRKNKKIYISREYTISGQKWFKIIYYYGRKKMTGYLMAKYVVFRANTKTVKMPTPIPTKAPKPTRVPIAEPTAVPVVTSKATPAPTRTPVSNGDFESMLLSERFPESYKAALRQLHSQNPNWIFRAYHTGLDWNTVMEQESKPGKNLLSNRKSVEWKSMDTGAYNWETDKFTVFDGSTWVTASKAAVAYYLDPRNFLTPNTIFQFELLKYQNDYQNANGVENILKGTPLSHVSYTYTDEDHTTQSITYGETFMKAAQYSGVSPYHLASRVKQEVVTSASTLSASVSGIYSGYEGYYNYYNIGAKDKAGGGAVANGLKFAKNGTTNAANNALFMLPWTNPYKAIMGGSYYIGSSYINRGQDTVYLQKFNMTPTSTYFHQYMTNVEAPFAEAKKINTAYSNMADTPIVFSIPVYLNMPDQVVPMPTSKFNPNNRLKSLRVFTADGQELSLTPTFDQSNHHYDLIVDSNVDVVEIRAAAVSTKANVQAGGYVSLNAGSNQITIPVVAENGDTATYTISIVREQ